MIPEKFVAAVGSAIDMACITGSPQPSPRVGNTKASTLR